MAFFSASVLLRPFNAPLIFWRTTGDRYRDLRLNSLLIFFRPFPINTWILGKVREKPTVFWVGLVGLLSDPSILGRQFARRTVLWGFSSLPPGRCDWATNGLVYPLREGGREGGRVQRHSRIRQSLVVSEAWKSTSNTLLSARCNILDNPPSHSRCWSPIDTPSVGVPCFLLLLMRVDSIRRWTVSNRGGSSLARVGLPVAFPPVVETRSYDQGPQVKINSPTRSLER